MLSSDKGIDGAGLDTFAALLARFDRTQLIGSDQRMVTQIQICNQTTHADALPVFHMGLRF